MLWLKAFHLIFMVTWFAGLFYLPRLFIYHRQVSDEPGHLRFCTMERKLFIIMSIGGVLAVGFGAALLTQLPSLLDLGWMQLKLALVAGLIAYHAWCAVLVQRFRTGTSRYSDTWLRWFNEVPAFFLIAIVLLAVLKP